MGKNIVSEQKAPTESAPRCLPRKLATSTVKAFTILLVCQSIPQAAAQLSVSPLFDMTLDTDALVLATGGNFSSTINGRPFQQEALITHDGYQYATWYHNGTNQDVYIARRELTGNTWETIDTGFNMIHGNQNWDAHNAISMGISGDGRIHLSYDHHVDSLRYATTDPGVATSSGGVWDSSIFNNERSSLNASGSSIPRVTYPRFANVGDDLVFTYRDYGSGNGDHRIADYDSQTGQWSSTRFVTQGRSTGETYDDANNNPSNNRNSYHNGFHADSNGRLHTTWNWREGTQDGNHDIMYAYSDDKGVTWRNTNDVEVGTNSSPITLNSPGTEVVNLDRRQGLINQQGQIVDQEGGVHVLMYHRRQEPGYEWQPGDGTFFKGDSAYHHYYRDPSTGAWDVNRLPADTPVGDRPRITVDSNGHLYGLYTQGTDLVIAGAQKTLGGYEDWEILYRDQTHNFTGTPLLDNTRLLEDGILSVFIQERATSNHPSIPTGSPLHVREFSINSPPVDLGTLIAGWDTWDLSGVKTPDITDGITAGTTANGGFSLDTDHRASTDGTWGALGVPAADITANDNSDAIRLTNGSSGHYDFTVRDTGGVARDLTAFLFDAATFRPNSARDYELSVLSGDLTLGTVATGNVPSIAGGQQDWSNFNINLTSLADNTLDAFGSVTFRLEFTGGTPEALGHHQSLDNVAIAGEPPVLPSTLIAGWESWSHLGVRAATVTDGNTTATTGNNTGNNNGFGLFTDGSTDGTWGTLDSPVADASTNENSDGYRLVNGENGSLEFTLTDTSGIARDLATFHFDTATLRNDAAHLWELEVVSGDLTVGSVLSGDAANITNDAYDWYDIDIDLTGLADNTLDANGTVTFRLNFTGGTLGSSGANQVLDNVGVSGLILGLSGDYNRDGVVNAADYTVWRNNFGAPAGALPNDPHSGPIGADQYHTWRDNYGQILSSATSGEGAAVPEPSSLAMLVLIVCYGSLVVPRKCNRQ